MLRTLVLAATVLVACAGGRSSLRPSPLVGQPVKVAAVDLDGREHDVSTAAGKVRIVDFWATWCDPCRDQLPFLDRLASDYGPRGLSVFAVAFDEDREAVQRYLEEAPVSFQVLWDKGGTALSQSLELTRLPTTLLVDRRGIVRGVHLGFEKGEEAELEAEVRRLLAE